MTTSQSAATVELEDTSECAVRGSLEGSGEARNTRALQPRVALLTPYNGGNLGDAAIQDAVIANLRLRLPNIQFSGVSLNCQSFAERHLADTFPLCANGRKFYRMLLGTLSQISAPAPEQRTTGSVIKAALKRIPGIGWCLLTLRAGWREFRHWVQAYRFLRSQDLLVVSGGGQMNEEWGGAWSQPYAIFKWAVLARAARIPFMVASVGAGKARSRSARLFLSMALRLAVYRSYRDAHSRDFAASMLPKAAGDPVVPDLAISLPRTACSGSENHLRALARGRKVIGVSPIAFAKPENWPTQDGSLYAAYVRKLVRVISCLLERDYLVVLVWSSLWDDESAVSDVCRQLSCSSTANLLVPKISTWRELTSLLQDVDLLIASRLHSVILGFVSDAPVVALSFDPKVDWVMEDFGQTDYLMSIRSFSPDDVITAVDRLVQNQALAEKQIASYRSRVSTVLNAQFDTLASAACEAFRRRTRKRG